jgi:hypothetical protein
MNDTKPKKGAAGPQPEAQPARKQSGRRRPAQYYSESEHSEDESPRRRRAQKPAGNQNLVPVSGALDSVTDTATGLVNTAGETLQGATGSALSNQGGKQGNNKDTLRLRLDLNLDVEITLKARIHGDLELALLYVPCFFAEFHWRPDISPFSNSL